MSEKKNEIKGLTRREVIVLGGAAVASTMIACPGDPNQKTQSTQDAGEALLDAHSTNLDAGSNPHSDAASADLNSDPDATQQGNDAQTDDVDSQDSASQPDANAPDSAWPSDAPAAPLHFLHLSDIHIGSGGYAVPALHFAIDTLIPSIGGVAIFATGDLVETGKPELWTEYRGYIDAAGLSPDYFVETPGNHDALLDMDLSGYVENSLAGRNGHGTHDVYVVTEGNRRIRVVALNTCSYGNTIRDSTGYLSTEEVDELIARIDADTQSVEATIVLGHHPDITPNGLALFHTDDELYRLLEHCQASAYLFGHVHRHLTYWKLGNVMMGQTATLGNPGDGQFSGVAGFSIFALDDGPAYKPVLMLGDKDNIHLEWPLVMITRPANPQLSYDNNNPHAQALPRASSDNYLHALVFSPDPVDEVVYKIGSDDTEHPMEWADGYYRARFNSPDDAHCSIQVIARSAENTGLDVVLVDLV